MKRKRQFAFQKGCALVAKAVRDGSGAALMEVVDLRARALQVPVMVERLESTQNVLSAATNQRDKVRRAKKPVPMHLLKNLSVAFGQLNACDTGSALETGKTDLPIPLVYHDHRSIRKPESDFLHHPVTREELLLIGSLLKTVGQGVGTFPDDRHASGDEPRHPSQPA